MQFMKAMITRVPYLKNIDDEIFFKLMFTLKPSNGGKIYETDEMILVPEKHNADTLLFIEEGILEVYTAFEGHDFVIERLGRGSALNHSAIFKQDTMHVHVKCAKDARILELPLTSLREVIEEFHGTRWARLMRKYENKVLVPH